MNNSAVGVYSLRENSTGVSNSALGTLTLRYNTSGSYNTAVGSHSLWAGGNGSYNTAIGSGTLMSGGGSGGYNTAIGALSGTPLFASITNSTAIGYAAIVNNSNSIQLGNSAVTDIYAGVGNNAKIITGGLQVTGGIPGVGKVLTSDGFGNATWQTVPGSGANWSLTGNAGTIDGINFIGTTDNIAFNLRVGNKPAGRIDPNSNSLNTFYGLLSGTNSTFFSTAVGYKALASDMSGINTAIGYYTLSDNIYGGANTAVGNAALRSQISGDWNTAVGNFSLFSNYTGSENSAFGDRSLATSYDGNFNCAFGSRSLWFNYNGSYNSGYGYWSLISPSSGNYNSALGYLADLNGNYSNSSAIGANAISNLSNKIRLGDVTTTVIEGQVAFSWPSDGRFKSNISEADVKGLEFINRLRPVAYNFDTREFQEFLTKNMPDSIKRKHFENKDFTKSTAVRHSGFIAQEVEYAVQESGYNFSGLHIPESENDNYSLAYSQFVVPLVKSVQELSQENEVLKKTVAEQAKLFQDLKNELEEIKDLIKKFNSYEKTGTISFYKDAQKAKLFQNTPNPFTKTTNIRYSIPDNANNAKIIVTGIDGVLLREFNINGNNTIIEISGGALLPGAYIYSLFVDNKHIDSKKMILTK